MANFTRTITSTTVKPSFVSIVNGKMETTELEPMQFFGEKVSMERAAKLASRRFKELETARKEAEGEGFKKRDGQIIVSDIAYDEALYSMPVETFLQHAVKVEKETPAEEQHKPAKKSK